VTFFCPYLSTVVDEETIMRHLLTNLRARITARTLAATTFCDACGEVCTPACRHEALREQTGLRAQEITLYRH